MQRSLFDSVTGLLGERDFDEITMGDIARRAGMARNTIYNYAPDKNALVVAMAESAGRELVARMTEIARRPVTSAARVCAIVDAVMQDFASGRTRLLLLLEVTGRLTDAERSRWLGPFDQILAEMETVVQQGMDQGEFRRLPDIGLTLHLLASIVAAGVQEVGRGRRDPRAVAAAVNDFLVHVLTEPASSDRV